MKNKTLRVKSLNSRLPLCFMTGVPQDSCQQVESKLSAEKFIQFSSVLCSIHHFRRIVGGPDIVVVGEQGHYQLDRVDSVSIQIYTILACIFISTMGKSSARLLGLRLQ